MIYRERDARLRTREVFRDMIPNAGNLTGKTRFEADLGEGKRRFRSSLKDV